MASDEIESLKDRVDKFIAPFQEAYSAALDEARAAAEMTDTGAWQTSYGESMARHKKTIDELALIIKATHKSIVDFDTNEKKEKDLTACVKLLKEERIRHDSWYSGGVAPFEGTAAKCRNILEELKRDAKRNQDSATLYNGGFVAACEKIVARWPKIEWDAQSGIVVFVPPPADSGNQAVNG